MTLLFIHFNSVLAASGLAEVDAALPMQLVVIVGGLAWIGNQVKAYLKKDSPVEVRAAEQFAKKEELNAAERRLKKEIEEIKTDFREMRGLMLSNAKENRDAQTAMRTELLAAMAGTNSRLTEFAHAFSKQAEDTHTLVVAMQGQIVEAVQTRRTPAR